MHPEQNILQHKINPKKHSYVWSPNMTSGLERGYSGFSAS